MLEGDKVIVTFCFCSGLSTALEFFGERDIIEECPGVVEFVVPCIF